MQRESHRDLRKLFVLNALVGAGALVLLLHSKSADANAILLGYSSWRLVMIVSGMLLWFAFITLSIAALYRPQIAGSISGWLTKFRAPGPAAPAAAIAVGLSIIGLVTVWLTGNWGRLGVPGIIIERGWPLILWLVTLYLEFLFYYYVSGGAGETASEWNGEALLSLALTAAVVVFIVLDTLLRTDGFGQARWRQWLQTQILPDSLWIIGLGAAYLLLGGGAKDQGMKRGATHVLLRRAITVFAAAWLIYSLSAVAVGHHRTPEQAYSPAMAAAFLQGKTYLDNPSSTVDLTVHNGHWYMPQPPLVALLLMPEVALFGPAGVNTVRFSIVLASLNSALVFLILEKMRGLGWIQSGTPATIWLTTLFSLGTVHWYLALWGEVWVLNQVSTVTFIATAALLTLSGGPAWLTGLSLGLAMLARPPIALTWPFLLGLFWELKKDQEASVRKRSLLSWALGSSLPPMVALMGLLWYNGVRFGSPLNFGYTAASVGLFHNELQAYGQFNIHFVLRNLQVMLIGLPSWNSACGFFSPGEIGMSVFITTPALLYLHRARRNTYWVIGAWITVGLLVSVLLLHYSTGALQFGYRYLMDLIIPIMALLGLAIEKERISLPMKIMILAGILVNYWGLWWFFTHWCR